MGRGRGQRNNVNNKKLRLYPAISDVFRPHTLPLAPLLPLLPSTEFMPSGETPRRPLAFRSPAAFVSRGRRRVMKALLLGLGVQRIQRVGNYESRNERVRTTPYARTHSRTGRNVRTHARKYQLVFNMMISSVWCKMLI